MYFFLPFFWASKENAKSTVQIIFNANLFWMTMKKDMHWFFYFYAWFSLVCLISLGVGLRSHGPFGPLKFHYKQCTIDLYLLCANSQNLQPKHLLCFVTQPVLSVVLNTLPCSTLNSSLSMLGFHRNHNCKDSTRFISTILETRQGNHRQHTLY